MHLKPGCLKKPTRICEQIKQQEIDVMRQNQLLLILIHIVDTEVYIYSRGFKVIDNQIKI